MIKMIVQHVTDPEICIQCSACEMACPSSAIENICGRYCIDASKCKDCRKCVSECPTGAANCYIEVTRVFSVEDQASWQMLPLQPIESRSA